MPKIFCDKVYAVVRRIPRGRVMAYKQVAKLAGSPRAARAVGTILKNNFSLKLIPCHRVVGATGQLCGYSLGRGLKTKKKLLQKEGVIFIGQRVDSRDFVSCSPIRRNRDSRDFVSCSPIRRNRDLRACRWSGV